MKKLAVLFLISIIFLTSCFQEKPRPTGLIKLLYSPVKFEIYGEIDTFNNVNDTVYIQESDSYNDPAPAGYYFISSSAESRGVRKAVLLAIYNQNSLKVISNEKSNSIEIGEDNQFKLENSSN